MLHKPVLVKKGNTITITSADKGAFIGYKKRKNEAWQVYKEPVTISAKDSLYVFSHRIGYKPSEELAVKP